MSTAKEQFNNPLLVAPSLDGDLSVFSLAQIIQFLSNCSSNGVLQIKKGALYGVIYFENGQVIDAHVLTYEGEDAIYEIFLWLTGKFSFFPQSLDRNKTIIRSTEDLIFTGTKYDQRWRALCSAGINPKSILKARSKDEILRMLSGENEGGIRLTKADEEFLAYADGKKTLSEITSLLEYNRRKLVTILSFLLTNNFIYILSQEETDFSNDVTKVFIAEEELV